ncbi:DUF899 domain-containing protein [Sphingomonas montanisoli]|uniref:DUF899 domain-containing protein n=1 Tax=Sphingomonas montanisoli TaxID=2606412 RepID=A0A5D9C2Y3_9SPHN|nr:thioredoxin family protein [Sphingomonas montanisoli]TZG26228.1 DUF899 domain-containing protein [Sphingomonas montanisoli]
MPDHKIVDHAAWLEARKALLDLEREETHLRDRVNAARLALPWERVEKDYRFGTPDGSAALGDLFAGRRQLIIYHFMLGPGWDAGCPGCSFIGDHIDGTLVHLNNHDVSWVAVSRAPMAEIAAYKARMGWRFPWVSSHGSDFNYDFNVSFTPEQMASGTIDYNYAPLPSDQGHDELHGMSSFWRDPDAGLFHTYSSYARGIENWLTTMMILDRAPLGRNETGTMSFLKRHDEYDAAPQPACCHS